uniref:DUF6816 domain-containing protein n=1 Tax=Ditylum brightwellii TaxID=49249 RepID=A0A6V2F0W3_9STRA|mmetsp:Transcript_29084/g.38751  ORF Transcript_29084/g.38751 Transcript_29084/m.38751 type:complete len:308 (+) Transcript_29084:88-1011(+)
MNPLSLYITTLLLPALVVNALSTPNNKILRRDFLQKATITTASSFFAITSPALAAPNTAISNKLDSEILNLPPPSYASELNGVDNTYFPPFLAGEWDVTQTLTDTKTPLGLKYLGGPNGDLSIAQKTFIQSQSRVGIPVQLQLRYIPTKWGVAEDRLYNTKSRLNAFAEKEVVANVQYADVGGSNRKSVLTLGGTEEDPLQTTVTYFKGPAAQKSFVVSHGSETLSPTSWAGYELQRAIFALTNQSTAPPVTTDSEFIWRFERLDENHVVGKFRIAGYLNAQSDKLYFDARNRAVSLQDYTLDMRRR